MTDQIYSFIREGCYQDAIKILEELWETKGKVKSVYSVLGYCYFNSNQFDKSAECYKVLIEICPDVLQYQSYLA